MRNAPFAEDPPAALATVDPFAVDPFAAALLPVAADPFGAALVPVAAVPAPPLAPPAAPLPPLAVAAPVELVAPVPLLATVPPGVAPPVVLGFAFVPPAAVLPPLVAVLAATGPPLVAAAPELPGVPVVAVPLVLPVPLLGPVPPAAAPLFAPPLAFVPPTALVLLLPAATGTALVGEAVGRIAAGLATGVLALVAGRTVLAGAAPDWPDWLASGPRVAMTTASNTGISANSGVKRRSRAPRSSLIGPRPPARAGRVPARTRRAAAGRASRTPWCGDASGGWYGRGMVRGANAGCGARAERLFRP